MAHYAHKLIYVQKGTGAGAQSRREVASSSCYPVDSSRGQLGLKTMHLVLAPSSDNVVKGVIKANYRVYCRLFIVNFKLFICNILIQYKACLRCFVDVLVFASFCATCFIVLPIDGDTRGSLLVRGSLLPAQEHVIYLMYVYIFLHICTTSFTGYLLAAVSLLVNSAALRLVHTTICAAMH